MQVRPSRNFESVRMIALDMDGTLLAPGGAVSEASLSALRQAVESGAEIVIATGRRHCYAMRQLRALALPPTNVLISSNGAVTRTIAAELLQQSRMTRGSCERLFAGIGEFRNALVVTFDCVGRDGEDERGALVVEELAELHASIDKWMVANEPYIARVAPIEQALERGEPIQMMICGTVERMRRAEALLRSLPGVRPVGETHSGGDALAEIALHRTEYPERDLSIVDILPAGVSKGAALKALAEARGIALSQVMAIGDNWNDVSMLEIVGRPVLMGNAPGDLRVVALERGWEMAPSNDEDGVAAAITAALLASEAHTTLQG